MSTPDQEQEFWEAAATSPAAARRAIWDEDSPSEAERIDLLLAQIVPALEPALVDGARVLDLGCGVGDLTAAVAQRFPGVKFVGVDVSDSMLAIARSTQGPRARWLKGDGRTLPRVGRLKGAWSVLTFQHIPAEAQRGYVREVAGRLEPGGIFRFQWVDGEDAAFLTHQTHEEQVRAWCEEAGLKVASIDQGGIYDVWRWTTAVKL